IRVPVDCWTDWQQITGPALYQLAATSNNNGQIDVFGLDASGNIFETHQTAPNATDPTVNWSGWRQVQGVLTSIAAARDGYGVMTIVGSTGADTVFQRVENGAGTFDWSAAWRQQTDASLRHVALTFENSIRRYGHLELLGVDSAGRNY